MPDNDVILKRLKDAEKQLDSAQEAAEKTTAIIEKSRHTLARAKKDVQLVDTSTKRTVRKRRPAGKKR